MIIEISAIISVGNENLLILIDHDPALRNDVVITWVLLEVDDSDQIS
jgi:hypothetical protein